MKNIFNARLCIGMLLTMLGCSGKQNSTQPPTVSFDAVTKDTSGRSSGNTSLIESEQKINRATATGADKWVYKQTVGKTGIELYTASIISADVLTFAPPFDGGSTVALTIRKRDGNSTVLMGVSKGQFTSSFQGGKVRVRFDNDPPVTYSFSAASDGATDILFFDVDQPLIDKIKSARKTVVDVGFYGQGTRQVEFRTAGLAWNH